jgi:hypothetical protein
MQQVTMTGGTLWLVFTYDHFAKNRPSPGGDGFVAWFTTTAKLNIINSPRLF